MTTTTPPDDTQNPISADHRPGRFSRARRRLRWIFLAGPALVLGGMWMARAQAGGHGPCGGWDDDGDDRMAFARKRIERVLDHVDATPDQKARTRKVLEAVHPEMKKLHKEKHAMREALHRALGANPYDPAAIEKVRAESVQLVDRGTKLLARTVNEMSAILTPDQRHEVLAMARRMMGHGPF
jgi:Spy/CpxP family protein refolding chaperone